MFQPRELQGQGDVATMEGGGQEGREGGVLTSQPGSPVGGGGTAWLTAGTLFPQISTLHDSLKRSQGAFENVCTEVTAQPCSARHLVHQRATRCVPCANNTRKFLESVRHWAHFPAPTQVLTAQSDSNGAENRSKRLSMHFTQHLPSHFNVSKTHSLFLKGHVSLSKFKSSFLIFLTIKKFSHHSINPP